MPLELREVKTDADFTALIACEDNAFRHPWNPYWELLHPEPGTHATTRQPGFRTLLNNQIAWHRADPTSHWFAVVDTDLSDMVVAGAQWNEYPENPYKQSGIVAHPLEATWWPEGEQRQFANLLLDQWLRPRTWKMARPHMRLSIMFSHPDHRRRGAGGLLMAWGNARADALGIDAFVEAVDPGMPLYEAYGYIYMHTFYLESTKRGIKSDVWREMEARLQTPVHCHFMWRPCKAHRERSEQGERSKTLTAELEDVPWDKAVAEVEGVSVCKWRPLE